MKRLFIQSILLGICHLCFSQITTNEPPISVLKGIVSENLYTNTRIINLAVPNMVRILYEDSINSYKADMLQRCAVKIPVSINMYEYGDWIDLDDGGKLWQLSLIAKDAKSLDITFNKFWIPKGGKFFVFNPNTNETIGAVTSEYLLGNRESPHRFSTGIIKGDIITLEYYQPQSVEELPVIELSGIFYGYRVSNNKSLGFGYSGSCNINVNCAEGADWQFEKKAVARIYIKLTNDAGWCTGSLLNNTNNDFSPLFLTANHCLVGASETKDAITNPDASDWIFYWDYETECSGSNSEPQSKTTVGAVIKANNNYYSDFALLRLIQDPRNLSGFTPQYLGWDVSGNSGYQGACIHHPKGDVKKISIVANTPTSTDYLNYFINTAGDSWRVTWEDGVTEPGSSGAPLFNSTHSVIGQLHGGNSSCDNPTGSDWYGKLSLSWTGNGNTDSRRRLIDWLDPNNTGITIMPSSFDMNFSGQTYICNSSTATYTINNLPSVFSVNWYLSDGFGPTAPTLQSSGSTCTITNNLTSSYMGKLHADIYYQGALYKSFQQQIVAYGGFYGMVTTTNQQFSPSSPVWVTPGNTVTLKSPNLVQKNVSYSVVNPSAWQYYASEGALMVGYPGGSSAYQPIVISIQNNTLLSDCDNSYQILIMPTTVLPHYQIQAGGDNGNIMVELTTETDEEAKKVIQAYSIPIEIEQNPTWTLEVFDAASGTKLITKNVTGTSAVVATGKSRGVFVVRATIGKEVLSEKVVLK